QALGFYTALLVDQARDPDDTVRGESALLLDLLTPIIKAWGSDYSLKANELAIQILGGYGYTREYPVEQCYRDNRINPIHEGTNGIQALDLLGRKAMMQNGAALKLLLREIGASCAQAAALPELQALAAQLGAAAKLAGATTAAVGQRMAAGEVRLGLANAGHYMTLLGHVVIGWLWLRQATIAQNALAGANEADTAFYQGKLQACRFFFAHELPQVELAAKLVSEAEPSAHAMRPDWF
ncbi:acyl-CoA dehydrogenase, partial [Lysobacter sp. 2RAB21]